MLRALVVDDEKPARDDLIWMLQREAAIGEIEEATGGTDALKLLTNNEAAFDVVFLDMKMPDLNGLDIARTIGRFEQPPAIVFVTAFDTPASDAFDLGVIDYLRKPVAVNRLRRAISKVEAHSASEATEPPQFSTQPARIAVSAPGGRQLFLGPSDVSHFESNGDYVRVHVDGGSHLVRDTMTRLTAGWSEEGFVRIHRSFAVRLDAIDEVRSAATGRTVCVGSIELPVSRRYARELSARLAGVRDNT